VRSALDLGADFDIEEDAYLEPLHQDPRWSDLLARREETRAFVGTDDVRVDLGRGDLLTESFAYDPRDGSFYFGSVAGRNILHRDADGKTSDFVGTEEFGLPSVLGVKLESGRNWLWALGTADSSLFGHSPGLRTGVWAFRLEDGTLVNKWLAPDDGNPHNFNDLTLDDEGNLYVTDARSGTLFELSPLVGRLQMLFEPGSLSGPNGIAFDPSRKLLYVSEYGVGLRAIDLAANESWHVQTPATWTPIGIDGLYCYQGDLVCIQNAMGMSRVSRMKLDGPGRRIVQARTLQANHPLADDPTTGVLVGDELWYIVNSHIATYGQHPERLKTFAPTQVQRVRLQTP
jgi:sugar lactone lactonase YvrE